VAQVVHPDSRQPGVGGELAEMAQHVLVAQGLAVASGEDQVLVLVGLASSEAEQLLAFGLPAQGPDATWGQSDPGVAALGLGVVNTGVVLLMLDRTCAGP